MPRLLLAPAGHGKTEQLIWRIRQIISEEPFAPVLVIVPNAIQAAGFRQRLVAAGGALGVEIYTFHTLYAELLIQAGQPMPLLTDPVRIRLLRAIVDDLCERDATPLPIGEGPGEGKIRHYAALRNRPGFITLLRNGIEELKRARIFPADFNAATRDMPPRLGEVSLIYSEYQDWLQRNNWADNEGRGWLAAIALKSTPNLGSATRFLAVSGIRRVQPHPIGRTFPAGASGQRNYHHPDRRPRTPAAPAQRRFQRAQAAITSSLGIEPEMMGTETQLIGEIAQVEDLIFDIRTSNIEYQTQISSSWKPRPARWKSAPALRWLKARIGTRRHGPGRCGRAGRDIEPYRPFLEETAAEFGIPMRILGGQPLIENPAVAALLSLLSLPVEDWPRRPVLDAWRSPYFDWSGLQITPESATALDEISRAGKVLQGLSQWDEAFEIWEKKQILADEDGELPKSMTPTDKFIREKFEAFVDLLTVPEHATVKQFIAFIENLMGEDPALASAQLEVSSTNIVACARAAPETSERDVAALRAFKDVLRGLVGRSHARN